MAAPDVPPIQVPDDFTVWAGSDLHGQLRAVDRLLARAGLTDGADRWTAPARTALVITGDLVDRGPDSVGLVRRLASLRAQAPRAGGMVAILEGNHEAQVLGGLGGEPEIFRALMTFGGGATLLAAGMHPADWAGRSSGEIAARVAELVPDLIPTLWTFAPYARWRDVLLVHDYGSGAGSSTLPTSSRTPTPGSRTAGPGSPGSSSAIRQWTGRR